MNRFGLLAAISLVVACSRPLFPECNVMELSAAPSSFDAGGVATVELTFASPILDPDGGIRELGRLSTSARATSVDGGQELIGGSIFNDELIASLNDAGTTIDPNETLRGELLTTQTVRLTLPRRMTAAPGTLLFRLWKSPPEDATLTLHLPGPVSYPPDNCVGYGETNLELR